MAANAPMMTKAALVDGRTDVGVLPTGQVVGTIEELPTVADLIARIVDEATAVLDGFAGAGGTDGVGAGSTGASGAGA
jgi:NAD(P)H-dependent flavin oxidoreductase YrpB (nitropropane dioxygenase family)